MDREGPGMKSEWSCNVMTRLGIEPRTYGLKVSLLRRPLAERGGTTTTSAPGHRHNTD